MAMVEINDSNSSEKGTKLRKFDENTQEPTVNNAFNEFPNSSEHLSTSIHSIAPPCWSVKQQDYFTFAYPRIMFTNGKLGCRDCRNVDTLRLHGKQRNHMSKE